MVLPSSLQQALSSLLYPQNLNELLAASKELSSRYRDPSSSTFLSTNLHRMAYLATRLPATYEAIYAVASQLKNWFSDLTTMLDLGAGPGTGMWAMVELFPSLEKISLIERDSRFIEIGKSLASFSSSLSIQSASWHAVDMMEQKSAHEIVLLSYSLGELPKPLIATLIDSCWRAAQKVLVVIEPGTPRGYETIQGVRDLLRKEAHLLAPCPQSGLCPMRGGKNWCHFPVRVARSSTHRLVKRGSLGYEDEKFSYVIFSKEPGRSYKRVVQHPQRRKGHVDLQLCAEQGLERLTVSKREKELYKLAKKVQWGDSLP